MFESNRVENGATCEKLKGETVVDIDIRNENIPVHVHALALTSNKRTAIKTTYLLHCHLLHCHILGESRQQAEGKLLVRCTGNNTPEKDNNIVNRDNKYWCLFFN